MTKREAKRTALMMSVREVEKLSDAAPQVRIELKAIVVGLQKRADRLRSVQLASWGDRR